MVSNAGISAFGITEAFTIEEVTRHFDTNVIGPLRLKRAVRMRWFDEVLVTELNAGTTQVLILGAGLDFRALRF